MTLKTDSLTLTSFCSSKAQLKQHIHVSFKVFNFNTSYIICFDNPLRAIQCQFNDILRDIGIPLIKLQQYLKV